VVNEGTVFAGGNGMPPAAGAAVYNYHNGNNSALGQLSGAAAVGRQIVVNAAGTLNFIGDDTFGDRAAAIKPVTIVANGGLVTNGPSVPNNGTPVNTGFQGAFTLLGPVQLDGGTLRSTIGKFRPDSPSTFPGFQAFAFRSTLTSSGNSTIETQISGTVPFGGFRLGGAVADPSPTFNVTGGIWTLMSGGATWTFEQSGGTLSVVPEPSAYALAMAGAALVGLVGGRRRRSALGRIQ